MVREKICQLLSNGNSESKELWNNIHKLIARDARSIQDFTSPNIPGLGPTKQHWTILQHACNIENDDLATEVVTWILDFVLTFSDKISEVDKVLNLDEFVNYPEPTAETAALQIALTKKHDRVIEELLYNRADVSLRETETCKNVLKVIYENHHNVLLRLYSRAFKIIKDEKNKSNELAWKLEWDFGPVIGTTSHYDTKVNPDESHWYQIRETKILATVLAQPGIKRTDILLHPQSQLFLHFKGNKFKYLIWASVFFHFLWSLLSITFLVARTKLLDLNTVLPVNCSQENYQEFPLAENWLLSFATAVFFILFFVKELIEMLISPHSSFYWNQYENCAQWYLLFSILLATVLPALCTLPNIQQGVYVIFSVIHALGVIAAISISLSQATKLETLQYYDQLFIRGFKRFAKCLLAISLTLITFMFTLSLLLPQKPQFKMEWGLGFAKMFAMMPGEVNYDELFYPETPSCLQHPIVTKLVFFFFLFSVLILVQNLLIAMMVNDVEKLKRKYKANHLASRLEVIYLLEHFVGNSCVSKILDYFGIKDCITNLLTVRTDPVSNSSKYLRKFTELPKGIKKEILAEHEKYGL